MSFEKLHQLESIETILRSLIKDLGYRNLKANFEDDESETKLITIDGALDTTEEPGNDTDIEEVITLYRQKLPHYIFDYNKQGVIAVSLNKKILH